MNARNIAAGCAAIALGALALVPIAEAQRHGGGHAPARGGSAGAHAGAGAGAGNGRQVRSNASPTINHGGGNMSGNRTNINSGNRNVNRNVNVNNNVNVNVHNDGGCCHDHGWDDDYHPVATAAAVSAIAVTTAAVIGSMTRTLPPSCSTVVVNGISYSQCGATWYQPQYVGSSMQYVVVAAPR